MRRHQRDRIHAHVEATANKHLARQFSPTLVEFASATTPIIIAEIAEFAPHANNKDMVAASGILIAQIYASMMTHIPKAERRRYFEACDDAIRKIVDGVIHSLP